MADPVFWTALASEAGAARPLGVMLDGCRWLHENSVRVRGFPTVPKPCGDFIEEGRCQEARMLVQMLERFLVGDYPYFFPMFEPF